MADAAHGVEPTHEIFRSPLNVKLEFVEREKPNDYFLSPGTMQLGEKIKVWRVQTKSFPEIDPGLVSSRENFVNTPDAEIISGGINSKGPTSVAIGRHGNFLLWGFSAQPKDMTESARQVFVNAICYIQKFDGKRAGPLTPSHGGRDSVLANVYWMRSVSDVYINAMVSDYKERIKEYPPTQEQLKQIGDDPAAYFRKIYSKYVDQRRDELPADVRKLCNDDTEKLIAYYQENSEYLRKNKKGGYDVDQDVQRLRVSNRQPELLQKCIELLDKVDQSALAIRVLQRYTDANHDNADAWRKWWQDHRTNIRYDATREVFVTPTGNP